MFRYWLIFAILAITLAHGKDCPPPEREGVCPARKGAGACIGACSSDYSCEEPMKCCPNGCGQTCMMPVKPGSCPPVKKGAIGVCVDLCTGDYSCEGDMKCCSQGCGHACTKPV